MEDIFIKRLEELNVSKEEKEKILKDIKLFTKIYFRGIRDYILQKN